MNQNVADDILESMGGVRHQWLMWVYGQNLPEVPSATGFVCLFTGAIRAAVHQKDDVSWLIDATVRTVCNADFERSLLNELALSGMRSYATDVLAAARQGDIRTLSELGQFAFVQQYGPRAQISKELQAEVVTKVADLVATQLVSSQLMASYNRMLLSGAPTQQRRGCLALLLCVAGGAIAALNGLQALQ
jgi:hypothetical protein